MVAMCHATQVHLLVLPNRHQRRLAKVDGTLQRGRLGDSEQGQGASGASGVIGIVLSSRVLISHGRATRMKFWAWHRQQTALWQQLLGLDHYQLLWFAFLKGLVLGVLLTLWLA